MKFIRGKETSSYFKAITFFFLVCHVSSTILESTATLPKTIESFENESFRFENKSELEALPCRFAPGLVVGNRMALERCCRRIVFSYSKFWGFKGRRLTTYLETLRQWKCSQFSEECRNRTFAFTPFAKLVYDYFCDYATFVDECITTVNNTIRRKDKKSHTQPLQTVATYTQTDLTATNFSKNTTNEWKTILSRLHSNDLELEDLLKPCFQVALYEAEEVHNGSYHEVVRINLPGCEITWCGYDGNTLKERVISLWTCMSQSCRSKMVALMVICGILGLIITFVNITVIVVYMKNPPLLHSQGVYKVSLAFADALVGIFVFPSFIINLTRIMFARHENSGRRIVSGYQIINGTLNENVTTVRLFTSGKFADAFPRSYLNVIGFFTLLSLSISIYSLTIAGFDRLSAVYRPLSYRKDIAKKWAKRLCVGMWIIGALFSFIPIFAGGINYSLLVSILIASGGQDAIILYIVAFIIPLLLMWVINGLTFQFTKRHSKVRRHLTMDSKRKTDSIETRLARTLSIMAGAFTLSIVPAALVLVSQLISPSLDNHNLQEFKPIDFQIYNVFELLAVIILACNSLWNFFIYSARNFEFRKALRNLKKEVLEKLGAAQFCSRFVLCASGIADNTKRRISNLPTSSTEPPTSTTARKKSSLIPTSIFNFTSRKSDASIVSDNVNKTITGSSSATVESAKTSKIEDSLYSSNQSREVSLDSETPSQKTQYTRNQNEKKKKNDNSIMATDDSIFQSFAIDANADRLFLSVMENIDEEIIEDKLEAEIKAK